MGEWKGLTRLKGSKQFCLWSRPHRAQVAPQRVQLHVVHVIVTRTSVRAWPVWKKEVSRPTLLLNSKQTVITVYCKDSSSHCYKSLNITTEYIFFLGGISPRSLVSSSVGQTDVASQTLSTGDIVITRIFFTEEEKERERSLTSSPKRCPPPQ